MESTAASDTQTLIFYIISPHLLSLSLSLSHSLSRSPSLSLSIYIINPTTPNLLSLLSLDLSMPTAHLILVCVLLRLWQCWNYIQWRGKQPTWNKRNISTSKILNTHMFTCFFKFSMPTKIQLGIVYLKPSFKCGFESFGCTNIDNY